MSNADLWYVKLADGDVHRVNLDQLDDAFQAGHIDADTMILPADSTKWTTLGALLNLDDEAGGADKPDGEVQGATSGSGTEVLQYIPQPPPRVMAPPIPGARTSYLPQAQGQVQSQLQGPPARPGSTLQLPVQAPPPPFPNTLIQPQFVAQAYGPPEAAAILSQRAPAGKVSPNSLRPLSVDLGDFHASAAESRRSGGKRWALALMALSAVGGLGAVGVGKPRWAQPMLSRVGLHSSTAAAIAAPPVGTVDSPPPPAAEPPSPPQVAGPPPAASIASNGESPLSPRFSDSNSPEVKLTSEQKRKLAEADKQKAGKAHGKGIVGAPTRPGKAKSTTFTTGGNKYDPLNSSI